MNADQTDATHLIALYGLAIEFIVPCLQEPSYASGVIGSKLHKLVEEGADISTLPTHALKTKQRKQAFAQLVESQPREFILLKLLELLEPLEPLELLELLEPLKPCMFHISPCELVIRMNEQPHALNQQVHGG